MQYWLAPSQTRECSRSDYWEVAGQIDFNTCLGHFWIPKLISCSFCQVIVDNDRFRLPLCLVLFKVLDFCFCFLYYCIAMWYFGCYTHVPPPFLSILFQFQQWVVAILQPFSQAEQDSLFHFHYSLDLVVWSVSDP